MARQTFNPFAERDIYQRIASLERTVRDLRTGAKFARDKLSEDIRDGVEPIAGGGGGGGDGLTTPWTAIPLREGWSTSAEDPAEYAKDASGFVHVRGQLINPAATSNGTYDAGDLPVGFRPRNGSVGWGDWLRATGTELGPLYQTVVTGTGIVRLQRNPASTSGVQVGLIHPPYYPV